MAKRNDKTVERERAYYEGQIVTVIKKGRVKSQIRTAHGFLEDVKTKDLSFDVDEEQAVLRFEPTSNA